MPAGVTNMHAEAVTTLTNKLSHTRNALCSTTNPQLMSRKQTLL